MSQPTSCSDNPDLVAFMDQYVRELREGHSNHLLLEKINQLVLTINDPGPLRTIANRTRSEYAFDYDIDTTISLLRRWVELDPQSTGAKRFLGGFLFQHGPDWDEEAQRLLDEADQEDSKDATEES